MKSSESVEVRNEGAKPIFVAVCRTETIGKLYVHVSGEPEAHWTEEVRPKDYRIVTVQPRRM